MLLPEKGYTFNLGQIHIRYNVQTLHCMLSCTYQCIIIFEFIITSVRFLCNKHLIFITLHFIWFNNRILYSKYKIKLLFVHCLSLMPLFFNLNLLFLFSLPGPSPGWSRGCCTVFVLWPQWRVHGLWRQRLHSPHLVLSTPSLCRATDCFSTTSILLKFCSFVLFQMPMNVEIS